MPALREAGQILRGQKKRGAIVAPRRLLEENRSDALFGLFDDAFAVQADVETFALLLVGDTESDHDVDDF